MKTAMKQKISLQFGATCPPLALLATLIEQLQQFDKLLPSDLHKWQKVHDAIVYLSIHGFLQESGKRVLQEKLFKEIVDTVEKLA